MSRNKSSSTLSQAMKKLFLSAFVVFAFIAYAIHERLTNSNAGLSSASAAPTSGASQDASASSTSAPTTDPSSSNSAANSSTQAPAPNSVSSSPSGYKDGTYTGSTVDVNYGLVEVQATIQNGKIAQVQFLQYPSDRRTSQHINAIAMPYLQQEAIQVQSANVDIVSGATLTSEGFQRSLQSALANAH
ncbi:MAG: FMN-binding protein [Anaerolineales bacterium]